MSVKRVEAIRDLIAVAKIRDVRLVETNAVVRFRRSDEVPDGAMVHVEQSVRLQEPAQNDGSFFVLTAVDVEVREKTEGDPRLSVRAVFELEYQVPEGFKVTQEQLQAFAELNGTFNAWPYMREFVQSVTARMRIPPITLPLYRVSKGRIGKRNSPGASAQGRELPDGGEQTH